MCFLIIQICHSTNNIIIIIVLIDEHDQIQNYIIVYN